MAVTENQSLKLRGTAKGQREAPIKAAVNLLQGTFAFYDSAGLLVAAAGGNGLAGFTMLQYDNTSGGNGDLIGEIYTSEGFYCHGPGLTQADVGKEVFATDNFTVALAGSSRAGRLTKVETIGGVVWAEVDLTQ